MLVRDFRRVALVLGSAILLVLLCVRLVGPAGTETLLGLQGLDDAPPPPTTTQTPPPPSRPSRFVGPDGEIAGFPAPAEVRPGGSGTPHTEIFSVSTKDRRYFPIRMGSARVLNPNIIPHPRLEAAWIVVAQKMGVDAHDDADKGAVFEPSLELVCTAIFIDGALTCIEADGRGFGEPTTLPVQPTAGDASKCTGDLEFFNLNVGPHDARVFYGPRDPYTIYGSNSNFNCFGQWIRDFRGLVPEAWGGSRSSSSSSSAVGDDWMASSSSGGDNSGGSGSAAAAAAHDEFASPAGTELQRPPPYGAVEKNWFLFWDADGAHHVHYDMTPRRAFARLNGDGSAGEEDPASSSSSAARDGACLARHLPALTPGAHESLHQATNSLSVTLCRRADPACVPGDDNTFIFTVVHHKVYRDFHSVYEPYAVVFRRRAPFAVFAVGARPLWVSGRQVVRSPGKADSSEMFYVTSISWKTKGLKYHGYVDDVMFLAFGIEDERAAGIDVQAGSVLAHLGLCDDGEGVV